LIYYCGRELKIKLADVTLYRFTVKSCSFLHRIVVMYLDFAGSFAPGILRGMNVNSAVPPPPTHQISDGHESTKHI
jgi:hypothetical protein